MMQNPKAMKEKFNKFDYINIVSGSIIFPQNISRSLNPKYLWM